jgi:hypothetical protein
MPAVVLASRAQDLARNVPAMLRWHPLVFTVSLPAPGATVQCFMKAMVVRPLMPQAIAMSLSGAVVPWPHVLEPILCFKLQGRSNSSTCRMCR